MLGIEHIGSTAVPEIPSRPVIDILIGVKTIGDPCKSPFNLRLRSYEFLGNCDLPGRLVYRKREDGMFDLHVVEYGGQIWRKSIRLRDYLHEHSDEARNYGLEKVRILNVGSWTAKRYLAARAKFFNPLMAKANT